MGLSVAYFDPCDYGDPWRKKTCLWGQFNMPATNPVKPVSPLPIHWMSASPERSTLRSITPPGFAKAVFEANR